jgi:SAM-dependent methyltransferase
LASDPSAPLAITGVCDGVKWTAGEIEFAGSGIATLWVDGLPDSVSIALVDVLLDGVAWNVEYISPPRAGEPRQINARLPPATGYGEYSLRVRVGGLETPPVAVKVVRGERNLALQSFVRNLHDEEAGVRHRMEHFYIPLFQGFCEEHRLHPSQVRVLDCGCGNAISVELLAQEGFRACGVDSWPFRLQQWQGRRRAPRSEFALADARQLPFRDGAFDIILSCGVLEHVGVEECCAPTYSVRALADQRECRQRFVAECLRVLRQPGAFYLDYPNGAFPVDFWHPRDHRNLPRWHWPSEKFLPTARELRQLVQASERGMTIRALSPAGRFKYERTGRRWYGKLLRQAVEFGFRRIRSPRLSWLAESRLNPYLVLKVSH